MCPESCLAHYVMAWKHAATHDVTMMHRLSLLRKGKKKIYHLPINTVGCLERGTPAPIFRAEQRILLCQRASARPGFEGTGPICRGRELLSPCAIGGS